MKIGVFAGSFCPITVGHVDAIQIASRLVDELYVVVGVNPSKKYALSDNDRLHLAQKALAHVSNVKVVSHQGMLTDFCKSVGATVMVKSVRNAVDVQQVLDLVDVNRNYWQGETVFVVGNSQYRHVSSSLVRELASLGQDISKYVPAVCLEETVQLFLR